MLTKFAANAVAQDPATLKPRVRCHDLDVQLLSALTATDPTSRNILKETLEPNTPGWQFNHNAGNAFRDALSQIAPGAAITTLAGWLLNAVSGGLNQAF